MSTDLGTPVLRQREVDVLAAWDGIQCVSRQMNKGFAYAFERSGLCKLRAERLKARQVDDSCDRLRSV